MNFEESTPGDFEPINQMPENSSATDRGSLLTIKVSRVLAVLFWGIILFVVALYYGIINP